MTEATRFSHRTRAMLATLAVSLCATLALVTGGAATAKAAGPVYLHPGQQTWFPSWAGWGKTTICAYNYGNSGGWVDVKAWTASRWDTETIRPYPHDEACVEGWWAGDYVRVRNDGRAPISAWAY